MLTLYSPTRNKKEEMWVIVIQHFVLTTPHLYCFCWLVCNSYNEKKKKKKVFSLMFNKTWNSYSLWLLLSQVFVSFWYTSLILGNHKAFTNQRECIMEKKKTLLHNLVWCRKFLPNVMRSSFSYVLCLRAFSEHNLTKRSELW